MSDDTSVDVVPDNQDTTLTVDPVMSVDNWRETIPEDIRNNKTIQETKDITSMAKRLIDANDFISKSVRLPDDGDTSGMDELYNKLGRPESADKYDVKRPDMPEGMTRNEGLETSFLETAHKVGLNSSQVNTLMAWNQEQMLSQAAGQQTTASEAMGKLKAKWGNAFDERIAIAEEALNQFGNDETEAFLKDNAPGIDLVYEMAKNLVEGSVQGNPVVSHIRTPQQAQMEIDKLNRDEGFKEAYYNAKDPTHAAAVEQMRLLMVEAHPEPEPVVY